MKMKLPAKLRLVVLQEKVEGENAYRYTLRIGDTGSVGFTTDKFFESGDVVHMNKSLSPNEDGYVVISYVRPPEDSRPLKSVFKPSHTDPKKAYRALALRITTEER